MNYGYTYPIYAKRYPLLNSPLVELVYQSYLLKGGPIRFVDIGAAIGDTILLLLQKCENMIGRAFAVEGDDEFSDFLSMNLGSFPMAKIFHVQVSSKKGAVARRLVRTHPGTASAQGDRVVQSTTIDSLLAGEDIDSCDVIKIDVDGSDGQVLLGSRSLLQKKRPSVIFEWHPQLCRQTGNNWLDHFALLSNVGYDRFVWFTKEGRFSHFTPTLKKDELNTLADLCLRGHYEPDCHYDIIALHKSSALSPVLLAETRFARSPH